MCRKVCLAALVVCFVASIAQAGLITAIERRNSTNLPPQIAGPLAEGSLCYVDRTAATHGPGGHQYKEIPAEFLGADYVMVANNDRTVATYELDVTLAKKAWLFLFIDNRIGDNVKTDPPNLSSAMLWVGTMGFVDTGKDLSIDEKGDGSIDNYFSIFAKEFSAGTITLKEQNAGSLNMYGVAAIPEPATVALLGLGALALLRRRK